MNIDETLTAKGYTPAQHVPEIFGQSRIIESITIHHWGLTGQTHDGVNNFFINGPGSTSAHYVVSAGRVNCLVAPEDAAWHAGNAHGNATSIGIECRPEASDGDYQTVADLVSWLRSRYGADLPLIPHRYWQATACPGVWDLDRINRLTTPIAPAGDLTEQDSYLSSLSDQDQQNIYHAQGRIDAGVAELITVARAIAAKLGAPLPTTTLVKGSDQPAVYAWDGGNGYRELDYPEFVALIQTGATLRTVDQAVIDKAVN